MLKRWAANRLAEFLGRRGYVVTRSRFDENHPIDLRGLLASPIEQERGRFEVLQIGANDGVDNDPIHHLVRKRGWHLCAVEPQPDAFARLRRNYCEFPNVKCIECAVGPTDGEATLYVFDAPRVKSVDDHLSSFRIEVLQKYWRHMPDSQKRIRPKTVKCLTLKSVIERSGLQRIDMLQIDTEGYDYEIVKMAFALGVFPPILCFEWHHLTPGEKENCRDDLIRHGYRWLLSTADVIATRLNPP